MALPIPTAEADGHGVTLPIAQGVYGTYEYIVAVFLAEPVVGPLYVAVKLTSESVPVTAAEVLVTGSVGGIQKNTAPAVPDPHESGSYEIEMVLNQSGAWTFEIEIDGPLGTASIETGLEVAPGAISDATGSSQGDDPRIEALQRILTRQAPAAPPPTPTGDQRAATVSGSGGPAGEGHRNGWFGWDLVGILLVLLALGLAPWALNRRQPAQPRPGTSRRIQRNAPKRRR
jgi:hypothetical protein